MIGSVRVRVSVGALGLVLGLGLGLGLGTSKLVELRSTYHQTHEGLGHVMVETAKQSDQGSRRYKHVGTENTENTWK